LVAGVAGAYSDPGACAASFFHQLGVPPLLIVIAFLLPSLVFGLAVLLWRAFALRGLLWRSALALPVVWVSCEYVGAATSIHGTSGNLAYSQMDFLPVLQLASVFGIWGISFCILFFAGAIGTLLSGAGTSAQRRRFMTTAGVILVVALGSGWWRLHFAPSPAESIKVGLLASDLPQNADISDADKDNGRLLRDYLAEVTRLTTSGARIIVLPEKLSVVTDPRTDAIDALFQKEANQREATIVVGVVRVSGTDKWNEARI
jgi:apolipoprotein N-acyltransferase